MVAANQGKPITLKLPQSKFVGRLKAENFTDSVTNMRNFTKLSEEEMKKAIGEVSEVSKYHLLKSKREVKQNLDLQPDYQYEMKWRLFNKSTDESTQELANHALITNGDDPTLEPVSLLSIQQIDETAEKSIDRSEAPIILPHFVRKKKEKKKSEFQMYVDTLVTGVTPRKQKKMSVQPRVVRGSSQTSLEGYSNLHASGSMHSFK